MKKILFQVAGPILSIAVSMHVSSVFAQKKFTFATYSYSANTRQENLTPLADAISREMKRRVEVLTFSTTSELIQALVNGRVDFAMINTFGWLHLQNKFPGYARCLVNLEISDTQSGNYGGCIITSQQSNLKILHDIKQLEHPRVALVFAHSTSGNLVPRLLLNEIGVTNPDRAFSTYYAGTHNQVVEDVLANKAAIGGCSCEEVLRYNERTSEGEKLLILAQFSEIPLGPIIVSTNFKARHTKFLQTFLLKVHKTDSAAFAKFCEGWTEFKTATKFKKIDDSHYHSFSKRIGSIALDSLISH